MDAAPCIAMMEDGKGVAAAQSKDADCLVDGAARINNPTIEMIEHQHPLASLLIFHKKQAWRKEASAAKITWLPLANERTLLLERQSGRQESESIAWRSDQRLGDASDHVKQDRRRDVGRVKRRLGC